MVFHFSVGWHCPCPVLKKVIMSHFRLLLFPHNLFTPSFKETLCHLCVTHLPLLNCCSNVRHTKSQWWRHVCKHNCQYLHPSNMNICIHVLQNLYSITRLTYKWFAWCCLLTQLGQCLIRRYGLYCLQHSSSIFFTSVASAFFWITQVKMMHVTTRWNTVDRGLPCSISMQCIADSTENWKCMAI